MDIVIDVVGFGILAILLAGYIFGNENTKGVCSMIFILLIALGMIGGIVYNICK